MISKRKKNPDFICIGAQKSGTSSLHQDLLKNPEIFLPEKKEVHFFSLNYNKGEKWYAEHFESAQKNQATGEITPFYLFHKKSAKRIHTYNKDIKIIILLRNPIERTLSHYYHARKRGFENLALLDALKKEEERMASQKIEHIQRHSYLSRSKYTKQLSTYYKYFRKENIMIEKAETYFKKKKKIMNQIERFIGVNPIAREESENLHTNKGSYPKEVPNEAIKWMEIHLRNDLIKLEKEYDISW